VAKLIYATPTSLDGYIADETGNLDWAAPNRDAGEGWFTGIGVFGG